MRWIKTHPTKAANWGLVLGLLGGLISGWFYAGYETAKLGEFSYTIKFIGYGLLAGVSLAGGILIMGLLHRLNPRE